MKAVKIINLTVFCTWAALISILLYKNYTGAQLERTQVIKEYFDKRTYWYDIYRGMKKIGFAITTIEKAGDEIIIKHEREMKVKKNDEETLLIKRLRCLSDSFYSIKSFEYTSNFKGEKGIKVRGEVDKDTIIFFHESPEKRKTHKISIKGRDFYLPITLIPVMHQKAPVPNRPFLVPMLNLINLSINDVRVVLEEIIPIKAGGNILSLYKFRAGNAIIWSNEMGVIIKEEPPSGITLYSQVKNIAKNPADRILFDYTSLPFFKSNTLFPDTEKLNLLKIKIKGFRIDPQLYENSTVSFKNNILTIEKQDVEQLEKRTYTLPYSNDKLNVYLSPDEWVLSHYRPLQDTGRIYARSHKYNALSFAKYLNSYLYRLLKTNPMFVLSNSKHIYKLLLGDYLERTVMFATYSRAGGLPTRLIGGLVYINGYFYFHTWPEVWLDKWVPVDPTLFQFPADVTHIPLKQGTLKDIVSIVDDLKSIEIEILGAS